MKPGVNLESLLLEASLPDTGSSKLKNVVMNTKVKKSSTPNSIVGHAQPTISLSLLASNSNGLAKEVLTPHVNAATSLKVIRHGFRKDCEISTHSDMISTKELLKYNVADEEPRQFNTSTNDGNDECDVVDDSKIASTRNGPLTTLTKRKNCTFNNYVDVISIPNRNEYSRRIRAKLWSTATELHLNASRNTIEFAADGWDWRTATEEDKMPICPTTGEPMHPIHVCEDTQGCNASDEIVSSVTAECQLCADSPPDS
jgi:hypothetical protein